MNISASQCGSGCESGWTLYLDQSSLSKNQCQSCGGNVYEDNAGKGARVVGDEEEEDLSMVSDASSGPRHYCEDEDCFDENGCFSTPPSVSELVKKSKKKKKIKEHGKNKQHSYLDDTASSPMRGFSKKNFSISKNEPSMDHVGFSATHFKEQSAFHTHYGFLQSSLADKPASEEHGGFQGRNWE